MARHILTVRKDDGETFDGELYCPWSGLPDHARNAAGHSVSHCCVTEYERDGVDPLYETSDLPKGPISCMFTEKADDVPGFLETVVVGAGRSLYDQLGDMPGTDNGLAPGVYEIDLYLDGDVDDDTGRSISYPAGRLRRAHLVGTFTLAERFPAGSYIEFRVEEGTRGPVEIVGRVLEWEHSETDRLLLVEVASVGGSTAPSRGYAGYVVGREAWVRADSPDHGEPVPAAGRHA